MSLQADLRSSITAERTIAAPHDRPAVPSQQGAGSERGLPAAKRRLLILTEIISPYRIPVFNALAEDESIDLHAIFLAETDAGLRQWRVYKEDISFSYEVLPSLRFRAGKHSLLLNWGLRARLIKFAPESIICGGYNYFASWEALSWARRNGVDFVLWSESNSQDARRHLAWVESLKSCFLARCKRFVVPGKASFSYLQSLGVAPESIVMAPDAVDNDAFAARSTAVRASADEFRAKHRLPQRFLLFVGRLVPEKGVFDLLDAYGKLAEDIRSQVALVLAGDGSSKAELEQKAIRINPGRVCFPGFIHREDLAGFYGLAEALVLPTHSDPWGLVVNEAMACGLAVVVSSVAGCARDLVEDGWNGYVVEPRDPHMLRSAVESLLSDSEKRQQMGLRSSARIRDYTPRACAAGLASAACLSLKQAEGPAVRLQQAQARGVQLR